MDVLGKVHGADGVLAIVGSGFYFSWFDALFMKMLFVEAARDELMAECGALLVFAFSTILAFVALGRGSWIEGAVKDRRAAAAFALCGVAGSLGFLLAGYLGSWALLVPSAILGGFFMSFGQFCWSAPYAEEGARTAAPFVTGAFSCAFLFDLMPLFMVSPVSSVVFSLYPALSMACYFALDVSHKAYPSPAGRSDVGEGGEGCEAGEGDGASRFSFRNSVGMSTTLVVAFAFMFVCFGFLQHNMSFAAADVGGLDGGVVVAIFRGFTAILLFVCLVLLDVRPSAVYRTGLLVMIVGCLAASLLVDSDLLFVAHCVIMSGFTSFNVLIYVAFAQVAYTTSKNPVATIAIKWLLTAVGVSLGGLCGILVTGVDAASSPNAYYGTIVVGYAVAMAAVLLLSSEDIWVVLGGYRVALDEEGANGGAMEVAGEVAGEGAEGDAAEEEAGEAFAEGRSADASASVSEPPSAGGSAPREAPSRAERELDKETALVACFDGHGLTAREKEIALLLAQGRTRAWIAESLCISENTVATHVRHIYQKLGVANRQEFIDLALSTASSGILKGSSPKTNDAGIPAQSK